MSVIDPSLAQHDINLDDLWSETSSIAPSNNSEHFYSDDQAVVPNFEGDSDDSDYLANTRNGSKREIASLEDEIGPDPALRSAGVAQLGDDFSFQDWRDDLREAQGFKKKKGRRNRPITTHLSPQLQMLMGKANDAYIRHDNDTAKSLLQSVLRANPRAVPAWDLYALLAKETHNEVDAANAAFMVAEIERNNSDRWLTAARESVEMCGYEQALFCYTRANRIKRSDYDIIHEKSSLLKLVGEDRRALDGFQTLLRLRPHNLDVVKDLCQLYVRGSNMEAAVNTYLAALDYHKSQRGAKFRFGFSEVNNLAAIMIEGSMFAKCISTASIYARYLLGRQKESWWNECTDDREWDVNDDRRGEIAKYRKTNESAYNLPKDLRVKLGVCRLQLGQEKEAERHFSLIEANDQDSGSRRRMYQIGETYLNQNQFKKALSYLNRIAEPREGDVQFAIGKCYKGLGDIDTAERIYRDIIEKTPETLDVRLFLAELYESTNRKDEALQMMNTEIELRNKRARKLLQETQANKRKDSMLVVNRLRTRERSKYWAGGPEKIGANAEEIETERLQAGILFQKISALEAQANISNEWLDATAYLVERIRKVSVFRPNDRSRKIGEDAIDPKIKSDDESESPKVVTAPKMDKGKQKAKEIKPNGDQIRESSASSSDSGSDLDLEEEVDEEVDLEAASEEDALVKGETQNFRGIDISDWFDVYMKRTIELARRDVEDEAFELVNDAKQISVFYQHPARMRIMHAVHLALVIHFKRAWSCAELSRWFSHTFQLRSDGYRLFYASLSSGNENSDVFSDPTHQKYHLRQIKLVDQYIFGKKIVGAAGVLHNRAGATTSNSAIPDEEYIPKSRNAILLSLYGHALSMARSHHSSLYYFLQVLEIAPNDPVVLISTGLAYLARAMQRQSENRQLQVIEAMTFLSKYYRLRTKFYKSDPENLLAIQQQQEADYNMGRSFHQIGLFQLAARFYEQALMQSANIQQLSQLGTSNMNDVLVDSDGCIIDLQIDIAYNLAKIYDDGGNKDEAAILIRQYFSVVKSLAKKESRCLCYVETSSNVLQRAIDKAIDTSRPTYVHKPDRPKKFTLSVALPGSIINNAQSLQVKTLLAGQIARALAVFSVTEIVVFNDSPDKLDQRTLEGASEPNEFLAHILQFLETPQYLRKHLYPMHPDLRYSGLLNSLDIPHHAKEDLGIRFREGIVVDHDGTNGSIVNAGIPQPLMIPEFLDLGTRVTIDLRTLPSSSRLDLAVPQRVTKVPMTTPREEMGYYWGYDTRMAGSISAVFSECPYSADGGYDLAIGTSERGKAWTPGDELPSFKHALVVLGGQAGIEAAVKADPNLEMGKAGAQELFDKWLNTCPVQGSRTIRTEEALFITLSVLHTAFEAKGI